jgi:hypothetical protein
LHFPHLHPSQQAVATSNVRFRIVACGRRWGKTSFGAISALEAAAGGRVAWWVAPTYPIASIGWRMLKQLSLQVPGADCREGDRMLTLPGGGWMQVRSADDPDSLRGEGLDLAILDEAAFMREEAWTQALRPALADHRGRALFLSTPKGRNWFFHLWLRGQDDAEPEYASWNLPSVDNPFLAPAEIAQARRDMPDRWFRQEHGAEFLEDAGAVFRGVRAAITDRAPDPAAPVCVGVDWGQAVDFTVLTAIQDGHVIAQDRFNQQGWELQFGRLQAFVARHQPQRVVLEQNSMGGPLVERAQRALGVHAAGFVTTAQSKRTLIDALALAIETREVTYPDTPELVNELEAFEYTTTAAGGVRMAAPSGYHDDCVMSLALAYHAATRPGLGSFADAGAYDASAPVGAPVGFRAL